MTIPPLSIETLLGTGIVYQEGVLYLGTDIGYIQNYYSLGLILTVAFYSSLLAMLVTFFMQVRSKFFRYYLLFFILCMFVVEYKEPFIFKYGYMMVVFALMFSIRHGTPIAHSDLIMNRIPMKNHIRVKYFKEEK